MSSSVPDTHRWPQPLCPKLAYNEFVAGVELPVVDLMEEDDKMCLEKLERACREWGFFHLVNHGVPPLLMSKMESISRSFFSLSSHDKVSVTEEGTKFHKLYDSMNRKRYTACSWVEGLNIHDLSTFPRIASRAWPEEAETICSIFDTYLEEMNKLGKRLLSLMVSSLGVDECAAREMVEGCGFVGTRFNYYPICPEPSLTLGVVPHSDPGCMTILLQDDVGGLQIFKEGKWMGVKPIPNALVINIGDGFQAWTNCKYKSVEHRAVVNREHPRISIAFFYAPIQDFYIQPLSAFVDEEHPCPYRPFLYKDYLNWRMKSDLFGKNAFECFAAVNKPLSKMN